MKLLLVEDDALLRRQVSICLSRSGHATEVAADAKEAMRLAAQSHYDLALIDLGLPGMSGVELIRELRARGQTLPILILSSRCHWRDKVEGLLAGADDYLAKPFQFDELDSRLNALLYRSCGFIPPMLVAGSLTLHLNRRHASLDGKPLELSVCEYRLLEHLMRHHQETVPREDLLALFREGKQRDPHAIDVLVKRLQTKLENKSGFRPIDTVHGQGYRFNELCI
ncbi:response regulator transcription factor [Pseudomonas zeae]|uniref:response regulator transcription factor n=1 Tax=Pseudomonas zeae TaxID=2745510 RepID=UPI0039E1B4F5